MGRKRKHRECTQNSFEVSKYVRMFLCGRWSFLGPGSEKKWGENCSDEPDGNLCRNCRNDDTPIKYRIWSPNFFEHPVLLKEESWTAKNMAKSLHTSTIMKGNIDMLLRTVISVNQLSIYGALTDLCKELDKNSFDDSADDPSRRFRKLRNTLCKRNIRDETIIQSTHIHIYFFF